VTLSFKNLQPISHQEAMMNYEFIIIIQLSTLCKIPTVQIHIVLNLLNTIIIFPTSATSIYNLAKSVLHKVCMYMYMYIYDDIYTISHCSLVTTLKDIKA
jgi:hypothetical protein